MARTKLDSRFFESTRGKIVVALRSGSRTVNDLAEAMKLSDNAIRAHLITLERDGLIAVAGSVKGFRKPHLIYGLTDEARHVFPKSYDSLFNRLMDAIKQRMPAAPLVTMLEEIGRKMGTGKKAAAGSLDTRVANAITALGDLGGAAIAAKEDGRVMIKSESCPFAEAVAEHPEICKVAESMVQEIIGEPVVEICERSASPRCRFAIGATG